VIEAEVDRLSQVDGGNAHRKTELFLSTPWNRIRRRLFATSRAMDRSTMDLNRR
jgi:hypothetical protein